jgi:hypothetical protein
VAATLEWEANAGVARSDNINRAVEDEQDAIITSVGLRFAVLQQTRRLNADVVGDVALLDYSSGDRSTQFSGNAAGRLSLGLIVDHLNWVIQDSFGQTRRDLFTVPSPVNIELVNSFSTGPDLRFAFGDSTSLLLGGRYTQVDYEYSPADSGRFGGWLGLERELSGGARVSLNASTEEVEARGEAKTLMPSYDRSAAYLRYELAGARTSVALDAGADRISNNGLHDSGSLLRAELTRSVGALLKFSLRAGYELTDSGAVFGRQSTLGPLPMPTPGTAETLSQTPQPYTNKYVELGWSINGRRTSLGLSGGWFDEQYVSTGTADRQRWTTGVRGERQIGAHTRMHVGVLYNSSDFEGAGGNNHDLNYSAGLSWVLGRLGVELAGERYTYASNLQVRDAKETRLWLRLGYGVRVTRSP